MPFENIASINNHFSSGLATHPIARLTKCLAVLLLLAGYGPAASSRLAIHSVSRTLGRVQPRSLG
jgi:hypothetical protein